MKIFLLIFFFIMLGSMLRAQQLPVATEEQLEQLADVEQVETEDDGVLIQLEIFKKHPINLNTALAEELRLLLIIPALQIENLLSYRKLLGKFTSIYELQAVPGWDVRLIEKILPFVSVANPLSVHDDFTKRLRTGSHSLLLRSSFILEKAKGFDQSLADAKYAGSRPKVFFRYRYQFKNLLQYGIVGDKDAGETLFSGRQKYGFDFYSFHFYASKIRKIQMLALGDFTVNMGQGLIQWQSLSFKKTGEVIGIKRQSAVLRPYNSSGEFYFNRGAGATLALGKYEITGFVSLRRLSANFVYDSASNKGYVSSLLTSGYHRTESELADKNRLRQFSFGGNILRHFQRGHIGLNAVAYRFSFPIQKRPEPYNLFALSGSQWSNLSIDYNYSIRNLHFFGEAAVGRNTSKAMINGVMMSVDPKVDVALLHRVIEPAYQAVYGNAFTENAAPSNENGIYAGITVRPMAGWTFSMYADSYRFPWLKYLVDAPSRGKDFMIQWIITPNRMIEINSRFRSETKQANAADQGGPVHYLVSNQKQSWRTQFNFKISREVAVRARVEMAWYNKNRRGAENGFLSFFDIAYQPEAKPWSANCRLEYFETDGYNSRLYAYEADIRYNFSIPAYFNKGYRYYLNISYNLKKRLSFWFRWAETIQIDGNPIGRALDEIIGNHRSEIKFQAMFQF